MSKFRKGQRVHVEFDGVVCGVDEDGWLAVENGLYIHQIWHDDTGRVVSVADPEFWPPTLGEVWAAENGDLYFAQSSAAVEKVLLRAARHFAAYYVDDFKALNPRRVFPV